MDEQTLVENLFDAIASARHTIRVTPKKPEIAEGRNYLVSFVLNVDSKTNEALCAEADRQHRSAAKMLRRYIILAFRDCIEAAEEEVKDAA